MPADASTTLTHKEVYTSTLRCSNALPINECQYMFTVAVFLLFPGYHSNSTHHSSSLHVISFLFYFTIILLLFQTSAVVLISPFQPFISNLAQRFQFFISCFLPIL